MTVNTLAAEMVMDRTTMGRNVHPLQRDGLIAAVTDKTDRRRKTLVLTDAGLARLTERYPCWNDAQAQFHAAFGPEPAAELRRLLHAVSTSDLERTPKQLGKLASGSELVLTPQEVRRDHLNNPSFQEPRRCAS